MPGVGKWGRGGELGGGGAEVKIIFNFIRGKTHADVYTHHIR